MEEKRQVFDWTEHGRFLDWFAGFVDGEGSFTIRTKESGVTWQNQLTIRLRDDDLDVLVEIQERLGFGAVYRFPASPGNEHDVADWRCFSRADCHKLVKILDAHPLRAKKARDYAVWREAVIENLKPFEQRDRAKMRYLADKIKLVRSYDAPEVEEIETGAVQLTFPACNRPGGDRVSETQTHAQTERGEVVR